MVQIMQREWLGTAAIIIACTVVLFLGILRKRMEWVLNSVMRGILGTIAMYFVNSWLEAAGVSVGVGINGLTVLTSATLGFPGLLALYGIGLYKNL